MKRGDILFFATIHTYVMFIAYESEIGEYAYCLILRCDDTVQSAYMIGDIDKGWPISHAIVMDLTIEFT